MDIIGGGPQGSVLAVQLFTIYNNDLLERTKCKISKFANNMIIRGWARCDEDIVILQGEEDRLGKNLANGFNVGKCTVPRGIKGQYIIWRRVTANERRSEI